MREVAVRRTTPVPSIKVSYSRFTGMYSLIVTLFCVTALQVWSVEAGVYSFTCSPNNTISISGLPKDLPFMYYFAVQSDGKNCSVTGNKAAGTAYINGCDKDIPIYFTYSAYSAMLANQIQGGKDVEILNITCYEISATGVADSISNNLAARIIFGDLKDLNVTFEVTSALNVSSVNVGEPVEWTINYPMNYTLQITSCSAYPGTDARSFHSVPLITEWCTDEDALITDFETNSLNSEASAVIQAFKFYNVDNVYLECDLKLCPSSSSSCIGCSAGTSFHILNHNNLTLTWNWASLNLYSAHLIDMDNCQSRKKRALISREDPYAYRTRVSRVLHINVPDTSSAVQCNSRSNCIGLNTKARCWYNPYLHSICSRVCCIMLLVSSSS